MPFLAKAFALDQNNGFTARFLAASLAAESSGDEAMAVARQAVALNPGDIEVLSVAASLSIRRGEFEDAARYLNRALEIKPDAVKPLEQLESLSIVSTWTRSLYEASPKVAEARRRVINRLTAAHRKHRLDSEQLTSLLALLEGGPDTFANAAKLAADVAAHAKTQVTSSLALQLASIFWTQGQGAEMLRYRTIARDLEPANQNSALGLSHAQLMQGREFWQDAWRAMTEALFKLRPDMHPAGTTLWTGQRLGKEPLLVYQDQGIGDAIVGLRFLAKLTEKRIPYRLWVLPQLADFAANVPGGEHLARQDRLPGASEVGSTFACPLFGLIPALGLSLSDASEAPLFHVPKAHAPLLRERAQAGPDRPRVGLMLGGNPMRRDDWLRSLPIEAAAPLARVGGVSWVNLMIDERTLRTQLLKSLGMADPMPDVKNFFDTAAIVDELDAVIAVDSSVAHLGLALGKKVWVLAPSMLDWRWQIGETMSPWWPKATVLRAEGPGRWATAVSRLVAELEAYRDNFATNEIKNA